jgi:GNAT superfamily N-acetyltransferase
LDLADDPTLVVRSATPADSARVTATLTRAFLEDPVWGSYLRDDDGSQGGAAVWWRFCVDEAVRYPWVKVTPGYEAVSVWIPPGGTEIAHEHDELVEPLLLSLFGRARTDDLLEVFERFESSHPHEEPHYYLSLLGTHPDARGQGLGMRLAGAVLDQIDAEHMPAYLESSNPALNDARYARVGFEPYGEFTLPNGHRLTTMWRPARP